MTTRRWRALIAAGAVLLGTTAVSAQPQPQSAEEWRRGTTLAGFGGVLGGESAHAAAGAALGWEIAPHLSLEGQGAWMHIGDGANAFAAQVRARVPLRRHQPLVPYAVGGVGLYRATFDGGATIVPEFYRRRAGTPTAALGETFDDFMVVAGGGVDVFLNRHLALRPEATALVVTDSGNSRVMPLLTLQLVYHFDTHPVTEGRRR